MNKIILFVTLIVFIFSPKITNAVYFATDTVYLYQDNNRVQDNALFVASYGTYSELCTNGICKIGQQFYPATIYVPKENELLSYKDFISMSPYKGGDNDGSAKDLWNKENEQKYGTYLQENSRTSVIFNPGPSDGGDECDRPICFGGRVGDDRTFNFDIATGAVSEVNSAQALLQKYKSQIIVAGIIVVCLFIVKLISTRRRV